MQFHYKKRVMLFASCMHNYQTEILLVPTVHMKCNGNSSMVANKGTYKMTLVPALMQHNLGTWASTNT